MIILLREDGEQRGVIIGKVVFLYEILNAADYLEFQTLIDDCLIRLIEIISGYKLKKGDLKQVVHLLISKHLIEETVSNLKLDLNEELKDRILRSNIEIILEEILDQIQIQYKVPTDVTKPLL